MRILHTSDWHFGKKLEGQSRINEQKEFIDELKLVIDKENIDMVFIAGDVYDTYNPSAEAEKLFFNSLKILSNNGKVGIVIIPGNHDNPQRLIAVANLVKELGVIIYEKAFEVIPKGDYGSFIITDSTEGGIEIEKNNEKVYLYNLPYPSETTLNETFEDIRFNDRIREILEEGIKKGKDKVPKMVMTHMYVAGSFGDNEEKTLELGGAKAIAVRDLPDVDYVALGHVHKPMVFKAKNAYYCGSPIEYRLGENKFDKKIFIVDITKEKTDVTEYILRNYKPIKEYSTEGIEEAIQTAISLKDNNEWIYLKVKLDKPLTTLDIKKIKVNKNIVEIIPVIEEKEKSSEIINYKEENIEDAFITFFKEESNGLEPSKEILDMFLEFIEEGEVNETN